MGAESAIDDVRRCLVHLQVAVEAWSRTPADDRAIRVVRISAADLRVALAHLRPYAVDPRVTQLHVEAELLLRRVDAEARV